MPNSKFMESLGNPSSRSESASQSFSCRRRRYDVNAHPYAFHYQQRVQHSQIELNVLATRICLNGNFIRCQCQPRLWGKMNLFVIEFASNLTPYIRSTQSRLWHLFLLVAKVPMKQTKARLMLQPFSPKITRRFERETPRSLRHQKFSSQCLSYRNHFESSARGLCSVPIRSRFMTTIIDHRRPFETRPHSLLMAI